MENNHISTSRLLLRPLGMSDWKAVHAYAGSPENTRYVSSLPNKNKEETLSYLEWVTDEWGKPENAKYLCFAIVLNGTVIGEIAVGAECGLTEGSFGWIIHRDYWGEGYATEAVTAIIDYSFRALKLKRLTAACDVENMACRRVMEKARMTVCEENEPWEYNDGRVSRGVCFCIEMTETKE